MEIVGSPNQPHGTSNPFMDLDKLYQDILLEVIPKENPDDVAADLRMLLGSIILLRDPLPVDDLEKLIGSDPGDASRTLRYLYSVILSPPPPDICPRAYHPSFPDFLQDHTRCPDNRLWIKTAEHEARMALRCLTLLNAKLHKGMLGDIGPTALNSEVTDLDAKIKEAFPSELQYACRFWASHLAASLSSDAEVWAALEVFASRSMLPWMESMSWLGETDLSIKCLKVANAWVASCSTDSLTKNLLYDGHRLLLAHSRTISIGAQHIAQSVLPFAPSNVPLTSCYGNYTNPTIKVIGGVDPEWPPLLMVSPGHSGIVHCVAFSSDGTRAASGSEDGTVRMWDSATGACIMTLEGHLSDRGVHSVAFSPDGTYLASGCFKTVGLWDAVTGICVATLEAHADTVWSVAFSPTGSILASASPRVGESIRLWSVATGSCVLTFNTRDSDGVMCFAFSHDGLRLVSGSVHGFIRIWDTKSGTSTATLKARSGGVRSVAYSPDGKSFASGCRDDIIQVWDAAGAGCISTLGGRSHSATSVTFPPDNDRGVLYFITSVAFSPNGIRLASGSNDETVRIWDLTVPGSFTTLRGHSAPVTSLAFSPDGSYLISGSIDKTVRLWDTAMKGNTITPPGHSRTVACLSFSPDASRLASGSEDGFARIWDTTSGDCIMTLDQGDANVWAVTFHPDGLRVAVASEYSVRLCDVSTGACSVTFRNNAYQVLSLVFSPDGTRLKSFGTFGTSRCWDVSTGLALEQPDRNLFEVRINNPFTVDDGRLLRTRKDGADHLVCLLPPWMILAENMFTSIKLDESVEVVAIGCENGTVSFFQVSSV